MSLNVSNYIWIKVEGGEVFDGNKYHWSDTFFSNPSVHGIKEFCKGQGWTVEFLTEVPDDLRSDFPLIESTRHEFQLVYEQWYEQDGAIHVPT